MKPLSTRRLLPALLLSCLPMAVSAGVEFLPVPAVEMPRVYTHPAEREPRNLRIVTTAKNKAGEFIEASVFEYDERGRLVLVVRGAEERYTYSDANVPNQWTGRAVRWKDRTVNHRREFNADGLLVKSEAGLASDGIERRYRFKNEVLDEITVGKDRLRLKYGNSGEVRSAELRIFHGDSAYRRQMKLPDTTNMQITFDYADGRLTRRDVNLGKKAVHTDSQIYGYYPDGRLRIVIDAVEPTGKKVSLDKSEFPYPSQPQIFRWYNELGSNTYSLVRATTFSWDGPRLIRAAHDTHYRNNKFDADIEYRFEYDADGRLVRNLRPYRHDWRYVWSTAEDAIYGEHQVARATNAVDGAQLEIRYFNITPQTYAQSRDDFISSPGPWWVTGDPLPPSTSHIRESCFEQSHFLFETVAFYARDGQAMRTDMPVCTLPMEVFRPIAGVRERATDAAPATPATLFGADDLTAFEARRDWSMPYAAYPACIVEAPGFIGDFLVRAESEQETAIRHVLDEKIPGFLREWADACGGGYHPDVWWQICEAQKGKPASHNFFCDAFERDEVLYHNPDSGLMLAGSDIRRIVQYRQGSAKRSSPRLRQLITNSPAITVGDAPPPGELLEQRTAEYQTATRVGDAWFVLQVAGDKLVLTVTADRAEISGSAPELIAPPQGGDPATFDGKWVFDIAGPVRDVAVRDSANDTWRGNTVVEFKRPYYSSGEPLPIDRTLYARFYLRDEWSSTPNELIIVRFDSAGIWAHLAGNESFGPRGRAILAGVSAAELPHVQAAMHDAYGNGDGVVSSCGGQPYDAFRSVPSDTLSQNYRSHERRVSNTTIWVRCLGRELDNLQRLFSEYATRHANAPATDPNLWRFLALESRLAKAVPEQQRLDTQLDQLTSSLEIANRNIDARIASNRRAEERIRREEEAGRPSAKDLWMRSQGPQAYYDCLATAASGIAAGQCRMDHLKRMQDSSAFAERVAAERPVNKGSGSNGGKSRNTGSNNTGSSNSGNSDAARDAERAAERAAERDAESRRRLQDWIDRFRSRCPGTAEFDANGGRTCVAFGTGIEYRRDLENEILSPRGIAQESEQKTRTSLASGQAWGQCPTDRTPLDDGRSLYLRPTLARISESTTCDRETDGNFGTGFCWYVLSWSCEQAFSGNVREN